MSYLFKIVGLTVGVHHVSLLVGKIQYFIKCGTNFTETLNNDSLDVRLNNIWSQPISRRMAQIINLGKLTHFEVKSDVMKV